MTDPFSFVIFGALLALYFMWRRNITYSWQDHASTIKLETLASAAIVLVLLSFGSEFGTNLMLIYMGEYSVWLCFAIPSIKKQKLLTETE